MFDDVLREEECKPYEGGDHRFMDKFMKFHGCGEDFTDPEVGWYDGESMRDLPSPPPGLFS